jgi:hypothetical protein
MIRPKVHVSSSILLAHCCEMPAKKELRKSVRAQQQQQSTTTTGLSCNQSRRTRSKQVGVAMQCNAIKDMVNKQKSKV